MKVKKEYLLLAVLIVSSAGYLLLKHTDSMHYDLPELKALKADDITAIETTRAGNKTMLVKKDKTWYLSPQNWRADPTKVSEMLEKLSGLSVTDLVSESKSYDRYQLDDAGKTVLKAFSGKNTVRELDLGKAAPTNSHTYVRLPGDSRIYLASGDLPRLFQTPAAELRDMQVLSFPSEEITVVEITQDGRTTILRKEELHQEIAGKTPAKDTVKLFTWKSDTGGTVDKAVMDPFLSGLSRTYAEKYLDDSQKASLTNPAITLKLKGPKEYTLTIFQKTGEVVPALSSQSVSPFVFPGYKLESLRKSLEEIAGRKTAEQKK